MQYRVLGKTGLKVPAVGFGGIPIQRVPAEDVGPVSVRLLIRPWTRALTFLIRPGLIPTVRPNWARP